MIKLLHCPILTPARRLAMITSIIHPEGLDKMYNRVLSLVAESAGLEKAVAKKVFCWLAFAKAPVTVGLLYELIHMCQPDHSNLPKAAQDFRGVIGAVCGALVEFDYTIADTTIQPPSHLSCGFDGRVRFIHLSVKEYFLQMTCLSNPAMQDLVMEPPLAHLTMARETFSALLISEPASTSYAGDMLKYATLYWVKHLRDSVESPMSEELARSPDFKCAVRDFIGSLASFLGKPFAITRWIHSYYQFGKGPTNEELPFRDLKVWLDWLHSPGSITYAHSSTIRDISHLLIEFINDMAQLVEEWGAKLKSDPDLLWDETAAFMGSKFIFNSSITSVTRLASTATCHPQQSSRPLGEISTTTADGLRNLRLSTWPSKAFEEIWPSLQSFDHVRHVKDACRGWLMRCEVWDVRSKFCIGHIAVPLDACEIWLAMRQLLRQTHRGDWRTAFPMSISPTGRFVAVLRTVYSLRNVKGSVKWESVVLPIDFTKAHCDQWTGDLDTFDPTDEWKFRRCQNPALYRYSIAFSPSEQYLLFTDNPDSKYHYAVFGIYSNPKLQLGRINYSCCEDKSAVLVSTTIARFQQARFHHNVDLIVICEKAIIYLWAFRYGELIYDYNPFAEPGVLPVFLHG